MKEKGATTSEEKILKVLLNMDQEEITVKEIQAILEEEGIVWNIRTISTFLTRMEEKGIVKHERRKITNYYYPIIDQTDLRIREGKNLLDTYFQGSITNFLSAFVGSDEMTEKDMEELRRWVDSNR